MPLHLLVLARTAARAVVACILLGLSGICAAAMISATVVQTGAQRFTYDYTVHAGPGDIDIEEFSLFFDFRSFSDLQIVSAPPGWDVVAIEPDLALASDGFVDALALDAGIAPGGSLGGFSVSVLFMGNGTPGSQPFSVIDPVTFATISSGATQIERGSEVPEPASTSLIGLAAAALWMCRAARRQTKRHLLR